MELSRRRGDFALAGVAAIVSIDDDDRCTGLRLALCGVGDTPVDASAAAASLIGQKCTDTAIETVAADVQKAIAPSGNVHASSAYQRHIAGVLTRRAIAAAHERVKHAA